MLLTDKRNGILKRILIVGSICLLPLLGSDRPHLSMEAERAAQAAWSAL